MASNWRDDPLMFDDASPKPGTETSSTATGPLHGRPQERGGSAPGERQGGRQQGWTNNSPLDDEWEARLLAQKVIKELVYQGLHAERERDQIAAIKLFLELAYCKPAPCYVDEEEEERRQPIEIVISVATIGQPFQ